MERVLPSAASIALVCEHENKSIVSQHHGHSRSRNPSPMLRALPSTRSRGKARNRQASVAFRGRSQATWTGAPAQRALVHPQPCSNSSSTGICITKFLYSLHHEDPTFSLYLRLVNCIVRRGRCCSHAIYITVRRSFRRSDRAFSPGRVHCFAPSSPRDISLRHRCRLC